MTAYINPTSKDEDEDVDAITDLDEEEVTVGGMDEDEDKEHRLKEAHIVIHTVIVPTSEMIVAHPNTLTKPRL